MVFHPVHDIKAFRPIQRYCIPLKKIWNHDKVSSCRKVIGKQLRVDKAVADDICKKQDSIFCGLVGRVGQVG